MNNHYDRKFNDIISGRNPVTEALRSGRAIDCLYIARGELSGSVKVITALAKEKGITIKEVDRKKLDYMTGGAVHQGVAVSAAVKDYSSIDDIFALAGERGEKPFIIVLDEIEDPHNLGAIIRTAECAGAHGIIIPKRRAAGLGGIVAKASAGAYEYVPVARVTNLAAAIDELKAGSTALIWTVRPIARATLREQQLLSLARRERVSADLSAKNVMRCFLCRCSEGSIPLTHRSRQEY